MSTMTYQTTQTPALSKRNKIGLALCGLLGLGDTVGLVALGADSTASGPPDGVIVAGGVLGIVTLIAVFYTWRTGNRLGSRIVSGARILSATTALPAFFVDDVSGTLIAVAGVGIVVTLVAIWLVLSRPAAP